MRITYIIFIIYIACFASKCLGDDDEGKRISSSYTYSIEYNDSDHGNFGHKIEVKDGAAKVNVRSENAKKINSAVASKPGKPYLPQKRPDIYSKPKEELAYVSAPESSTVVPVFKNPQSYSAPQVQVQPQKSAAVQSALQKYSQEQLAILLSQNKNPFLPIDPKDSISKFISKYASPQPNHHQSVPQTQPNSAYVPQVQSNNYLTQYQTHPAVSPDSKPQYPTTYYTPSAPQQNSQQYYQPQVQQSYQPHIPQTQSVPATQGPVQYVYVPQNIPQTASHPASSSQSTVASHLQAASYGTTQSGPVQFAQQSYQPVTTKQEYVPNTSAYQSSSYPAQQNAYASVYTSSGPSSAEQGKQYVTVPSSSAYPTSQAAYSFPKAASPVTQQNYQNVYGSQYPSTVSSSAYGSSPNVATYKPVTEGASQFSQSNFDFSKYAQYVPASNQASPTITYKPSEVQPSSNAAQYFSIPKSGGTAQFTQGNFDFSKYAQYVPSNQGPPTVTYKPSEIGVQSASNTAQHYSGGNFDFSKYAQQSSPTVAYKPSEAAFQSSSHTTQQLSGLPQTSGSNFDFSKYAQQSSPTVAYKPSEAALQSSSHTAQHLSGFPQTSGGNFDFSKYAQYVPASNQASPNVVYKPQPSSTAPQYISGASNYPTGSAGHDATKFGSNAGHNFFAGLQSSQNYGSLFSGATGSPVQDAAKYNVPSQGAYVNNVIQGASTYPQFSHSATPTANYKPVVENSVPDTSSKLQYQSPNVNSILGANNANFDISKFQSAGLANSQSSFNVPSGHNFNLNQISSVQAADNKYGQYAIDIRQGAGPSGTAVMVQTNYNLGAQNAQNSYSSSPASAASDNSNVRYVYVPSYTPTASSSPEGTNHGK